LSTNILSIYLGIINNPTIKSWRKILLSTVKSKLLVISFSSRYFRDSKFPINSQVQCKILQQSFNQNSMSEQPQKVRIFLLILHSEILLDFPTSFWFKTIQYIKVEESDHQQSILSWSRRKTTLEINQNENQEYTLSTFYFIMMIISITVLCSLTHTFIRQLLRILMT
jgi:hypothetical protein